MKKSLYFALAASFLFAACDEDYTDWADPQSSTEGAATVVSGSVTTAGSINGASAAGSVALLNLSAPEGCSISAAHIYVNGEKISFVNQDGQILVDADELAALVKSSYNSLAATTRALSVTGKFGMVNPNGEASPITVEPVTVNYTAKPLPANASEGEYWYVGGHNGWNLSLDNPDKFEDKGNGIYQLTIQIGDGEWFSFAPKSAVEAGDWNALFRAPSNGFAENRGFLDNDPTTGFSFCCETGGKYTFTLDMVNYTWSYVNYTEYIYYAGDWTSWGDGKKEMALVDADNGIYNGYYWIDAVDNANTWGFKFIDADGNWYGGGNGTIDANGGNMDPGAEGFYKIEANWANFTYTLTPIASISIIGNATGDSSWGTDIDLTWNGECWEYTGHLEAGEFKFRANHDWNGINWGGDPNNLEMDAANASISAAGDYTIKLYCNCPGKAYYTLE